MSDRVRDRLDDRHGRRDRCSTIRFGDVSPIRFAFLSRSSYGSMPSTSAIRLMWVSVANETDVTPKPRIAVVGTRFVKTT